MIYNDLDFLLDDIYNGTCHGNQACAGSFALAFYSESVILECDTEMKASQNEWSPFTTQ